MSDKTLKILPVLIAVLVAVIAINQYIIMTTITGKTTAVRQNQYGIPFSESGYQQLLAYDRTIRLDSSQLKNYVGLDVEMPCCGFTTLQAAGNCGCGHHIALSGLAKYLISEGYSREQVQSEINAWKGVFFGEGVGIGSMGGC